MELQQFLPSDILKPYVKCYWIYRAAEATTDVIYPSGFVELAINLSPGNVTTVIGDRHIKMPSVEVLGQLTAPGKIVATKGTTLLITRFYPHAGALFFSNPASEFTNDSVDLGDVLRNEAGELYDRILNGTSLQAQVRSLDMFLTRKLIKSKAEQNKLKLVERIWRQAANSEMFNLETVASQYGFSERYIQKLFLEFIGIPPKSFFNIQRFNKSLELVRTTSSPLTTIAYECGYYDQAHFIKEFRHFTGTTPSQFQLAIDKR